MASSAQQRPVRPVRFRVGVFASLLGLAALAWLLTRERMIGMDAGPGPTLGISASMWWQAKAAMHTMSGMDSFGGAKPSRGVAPMKEK